MVRALLVVQNQPVPRDRRVWRAARWLADDGIEVSVIAPRLTSDEPMSERLDGVHVLRFELDQSDGTTVGFLREYFWSSVRIGRLLWQQGRTADIIHFANPPDFLVPLAIPAKLLRGPRIVFDQHDLFPELLAIRLPRAGLALRAARFLERISYLLADATIVPNESYRAVAIERGGVAPERTHVVRNVADEGFTRGRPNPELRRGRRFLAVFVGMMGPQDGVDVALRVIAEYKHRLGRSDLHVAFVGTGDDLPRCVELASALEVDDMVEFVGWQDTAGVLDYLSTADVALAPDPPSALNDRSTMIKVVEYLAVGVPTISFDLAESVITAGDAAVFVDGGDVGGFANEMAALLDDPDHRAQLSQRAVSRSVTELSAERARDTLRECYRQLLCRPLPADVISR